MFFHKRKIGVILIAAAAAFLFYGCAKENAKDSAGNDPKGSSAFGETDMTETANVTEIVSDITDTNTDTSVATKPILPEPKDDDLVIVRDYIPSIYVELKYATTDNFTGKVIYDFTEPQLRYGTVKKLAAVQDELAEKGYSLKIWDAYRPVGAQFKLWEVCPDPVYVADPNKGYSNHSRGNTVDVTIVLADGTPITMPTGFDDFSEKADRNYSDVSDEAALNAKLLESAMSSHGFNCYFSEWWHFSDKVSYKVIKTDGGTE